MKIENIQSISYTSHIEKSDIVEAFQPKEDLENEDKQKSYATKIMLGTTILAGVVALGIAGRKGHLGNTIKSLLGGGNSAKKPPHPTPIIEPPKMEMNDTASKAYRDTLEMCDGHIDISIGKNKSETLKEMADFYREEEAVANLPKKLLHIKSTIGEKSIDDIFAMGTQNRKKICDYEEQILAKKKSSILSLGDDIYLDEFARARYNHCKALEKIIQEATQSKLENLSIKELWDLLFKNSKQINAYQDIIKEKMSHGSSNLGGFLSGKFQQKIDYGMNAHLLGRFGHSDYKHSKNLDEQIHSLIQKKRETIFEKLLRPQDKQVSVATISDYADSKGCQAFGEYYDIYPYNSALRNGEELDAAAKETIKTMDKVFEQAPQLEQDCVVYRAVHGHPVMNKMNEFIRSLKEGMIIDDPSYVSTSIDTLNPQFRQFANSVADESFGGLMRIKLPKGTKGVLGGYDEFLLPRNSKIKIVKLEEIDGIKIMDCEYILP